MKIIMLVNKQGSEDGLTVSDFQEGKEYSVGSKLATVFIDNGWAVEEAKHDRIISNPTNINEVKEVVPEVIEEDEEIIEIDDEEEVEQTSKEVETKVEGSKIKTDYRNKFNKQPDRNNRIRR